MSPNILLVGYGAIGFVYTYILQKGGANVTVVARSNYEAASRGDIKFRSKQFGDIDGFRPTKVVPSCEEAARLGPYDYVVLATKALPEVATTSQILAPIIALPNQPTYVLLQNGLGVEKDLHEAVKGRATIITTAIYIMANVNGDTVSHSEWVKSEVGAYPQDGKARSPQDQESLRRFVKVLQDGGSTSASVSPNIQGAKFSKNIWNACFATVCCLTRSNGYYFFNNQDVREKMIPVLVSVAAEANSIGVALAYGPEFIKDPAGLVDDNQVLFRENMAERKASTLIDIENGRPFEVEVILGELVRMGRDVKVETPRLEMMYAMLSVVQNQFLVARK